MKKYTSTPIKVLSFFLLICILFSCTKDSDLLADYVLQDSIELEELATNETEQDSSNEDEQPPSDEPSDNSATNENRDSGELKAFPEAEGFGKYATGGRGGSVYEVTNLNDSGSGSFRAAVEANGKRTVVFKVAGTISLNSYIKIENPDITIAGETAPGDGITIYNAEVSIRTSNVIIRNIRFRRGNDAGTGSTDAFSIKNSGSSPIENVIIDHCTMSWGIDESIDTGDMSGNMGVKNITISNSIIGPSGYGWLIWQGCERISSYRNLFIGNVDRNPTIQSPSGKEELVSYLRAEVVNNVVYGYRSRGVQTYGIRASYIGNVNKDYNGQTYPSWANYAYVLTTAGEEGNMRPNTEYYSSDNILVNPQARVLEDSSVEVFRVGTPTESSSTSALAASALEADLLPTVGPMVRDSYDASLVASYNASTAPRSDETLPALSSGTAYTDTDSDGMEDGWEIARGLNPNVADNNGDDDGDGYTNLEEFLYYLRME